MNKILDTTTLRETVLDPYTDPIPLLLTALQTARTAETRAYAAYLLRDIPSPRAAETLLTQLPRDRAATVRAEIIETLGFLKNAAALPALLHHLTDPNPLVRANIAEAFGTIGKTAPEIQTALQTLLADKNQIVRRYAAEALGDLQDPAALPALTIRTTDRPYVRVWVFYALARLGEPFPLSEVLTLIRSGSNITRIEAAHVLQHIDAAEYTEHVLATLNHALHKEKSTLVQEALAACRDSHFQRWQETTLPDTTADD